MRIGILGGTFDPIHCGHLIAAEHARTVQQLDRVLFVPANRSPLKPATQAATAHRVTMVRLAIAGNAAFALSTVDIDRPPPSYAVDTVSTLQRNWPGAEFVFLIGADQLAELSQWRAPEQLLQAVPIVALTRPGAAQRGRGRPEGTLTRGARTHHRARDSSDRHLRKRDSAACCLR